MTTLRVLLVSLAGLALSACSPPSDLGGDSVVLSGPKTQGIFDQCSRFVPVRDEGSWRPSRADIETLEAELPEAIRNSREASAFAGRTPPQGWRRQYVGFFRDGRRYVYGNFFLKLGDEGRWREEPMLVCDGGAAYFGVEYDAQARRIVQLEFNGPA